MVAITTALMPELSEKYSLGDADGYRDTFSFGLEDDGLRRRTVGGGHDLALRASSSGCSTSAETSTPGIPTVVSGLLVVYAAGLLGYSVYFYLVRAFYSRQNTKTPAALNVVIFLLYAALAYGLSQVWGLIGVVLGLAVAYSVLAILSLAAMRRETGRLDGTAPPRLRSQGARLRGGHVRRRPRLGTTLLGVGSDFAERLLVLIAVGGVSLAVYLGVAFLLGDGGAEVRRHAPAATFRRKNGEIRHQATGIGFQVLRRECWPRRGFPLSRE